ncbi:Origin recognition complex subunit 1 [Dirofilaria immitis]|nr:Origin recognition complex subunit 1 [Dirofilaria immitis]
MSTLLVASHQLISVLDLLNTKKQEIIYDIFNWSANEESLGANRLCFQPYDHDEVAYIIRDRLCGSTAVEAEAIELASRKVAAISGDLRKALDILRSATQRAITANQKQLTMKNVQEAIRQASTNVRVELIRALPRHSVLLLRAALAEQLSSGLDEFQFHILFKQYRLQCNVANINPVSASAAYRSAMEMCSERLLVAASGNGSMSRRFRLGITTHDVQFAFKQLNESVP